MKIIMCSLYVLIYSTIIYAQESAREQFSEVIEDNSFFIEEAFNQESGIVQHISNGIFFSSPHKDFVYALTQEWPLSGQTHQLSVTIPYAIQNSNSVNGFEDILLNYRYQLSTDKEGIAMSPRLSLLIPSGNSLKGLGAGVWGAQANFPVSIRVSEKIITHYNAGMTILPNVEGTNSINSPIEKTLISYNIGGSVIWLAESNFNVLFEITDNINGDLDFNGDIVNENEIIFSPGARYAIDVNSLQIVPGLGLPFRFTEHGVDAGIFFYLSFEHPF